MRRRDVAVARLATIAAVSARVTAAATRVMAPAASTSSSPCPKTLKFAGSLYLDTDARVPTGQAGPLWGEPEPHPARRPLPGRLKVYRHNAHNSTEEVVYYVAPQTAIVFRSAGPPG